MIPKNIKREHIIKAIGSIDKNAIPYRRESTKYDLLYQGKRYPPKYIISLANRYISESKEELSSKKFNGGNETNKFLENLNFKISNKPKITQIKADIESEGSEEPIHNTEGKEIIYLGKKYERSAKNRQIAIETHGMVCVACGFDFEVIYGEKGSGYIEVHHIVPLSNRKKEVDIDPKKDLVPVCSNCHRILHRKRDELLSVEELKNIIENNKRI